MAEHVETEHAGVLRYVKCHTEYATDGQETLLPLCEGDIVAVVQEKEETGWYAGFLLADTDSTPKWFPKSFVREVQLKPGKLRNAAVAARAIARMGGYSGGEAVHPGSAVDAPAVGDDDDGRVSPKDVNMSNMAAQMAAGLASKRSTTPPRVRTPERSSSGRISFASTKSAAEQQQQLSPPKFRRSAAGEEGAEEHLPTLTPLARSLAANTALARSRSSSAVAAGGQSPESRED